MFKIAIISDTHLGFKYDTELGQDAFENFKQAFELALKENPDLFLFPGDIFDEKIPRPEVLGDVIDLFKEFRRRHSKTVTLLKSVKKDGISEEKKEIPNFICIYGTHERRHSKSTNPVHLLEKAGLIYNLHAESILMQIRSDKIGLHGLSGVPENYARIALQEWNPKAFDSAVNILTLHQNFKELLPELDKGYIEFSDLPAGFDLFVLGHIHWNMEFKHPSSGAPILVPGSTVVTQMTKKESDVEKGFYIVDIGREKGSIKFHKIKIRPLHYFEIKADGLKPSDLYEKVQEIINGIKIKEEKPQVRINLKGIFL
jgi:DNA repair exonuclease SbcCD nuclease subunit